jgi:hypothetical protein
VKKVKQWFALKRKKLRKVSIEAAEEGNTKPPVVRKQGDFKQAALESAAFEVELSQPDESSELKTSSTAATTDGTSGMEGIEEQLPPPLSVEDASCPQPKSVPSDLPPGKADASGPSALRTDLRPEPPSLDAFTAEQGLSSSGLQTPAEPLRSAAHDLAKPALANPEGTLGPAAHELSNHGPHMPEEIPGASDGASEPCRGVSEGHLQGGSVPEQAISGAADCQGAKPDGDSGPMQNKEAIAEGGARTEAQSMCDDQGHVGVCEEPLVGLPPADGLSGKGLGHATDDKVAKRAADVLPDELHSQPKKAKGMLKESPRKDGNASESSDLGATTAVLSPTGAEARGKKPKGKILPTEEQRAMYMSAAREETAALHEALLAWPRLGELPERLNPKRSEMKPAEVSTK